VANRSTYRVQTRNADGSLVVAQFLGRDDIGTTRWGRPVTLPADYVAEHVALAYAGTIDSAQGITVDTCYPIITPDMDREALYVALSRGRQRNIAFVQTISEEPDALGNQAVEEAQSTPEAVLAGIIERERETQSARQVLDEEIDARESAGPPRAGMERPDHPRRPNPLPRPPR